MRLGYLVYPRRSVQIRVNPWQTCSPKNKCGPGQPPEPHRLVDLNSCLPAARSSESTALVRQRSRGVPLLPVLAAEHDSENWIRRIASLQPCVGQRPSPLKEQAVEEAAMPGQPVRARARFQFPPAIHPRELPAATGVTAIIILQALRFPRFAVPTLGRIIATRNRKTFPPCAETVDDRTSLWKPEEIRAGIAAVKMSASTFQ
jgi:hypothetical protein